jgi:hypothetical protein
MALPSSGAITLSDVNTNIGASSTATITMNDAPVRLLANGDTTTNPVTMNSLYGKSWVWTANFSSSTVGTFTNLSTAVDSDGNVYTAAGYTQTTASTNVIFKTNAVGILQWAVSLTSSSGTYQTPQGRIRSLAVDSSGNVYYACSLALSATPSQLVYGVVKLNSSGVVQWSSFLSSTGTSASCTIGLDSSSNVYVCNFSDNFSGTISACLAKYNASGALQWQKSVGGANLFDGGLVVDSTNNYVYLAGGIYTSYTDSGAYIGKFDTNLTAVWERNYYATSGTQPRFYGVAINTSSQNVHCLIGSPTLGVALYNSSGTLQWQTLQTTALSTYYSIAVDSSGNTYISGRYSTDSGAIVKYNTSGALTANVRIASTNLNTAYTGPIAAYSGYVYSVQDTTTSVAPINGGTVMKLPNTLSVSGTYGRVTFSSVSYSTSAGTYTSASTTRTVANSVFTQYSSLVSGTNVTSSYTRTVYPI